MTSEQALVLAINRIGGQAPMARLLDVAQPTVWGWLNRSDKKELPAEYVLKVEAATHVSRSDLRPDLYPRGLQDGVPFSPDSSAPTSGELSGATPEWPLPPSDDGESGNRGDEIQGSAGMGPATPPGDQRTQPGGALSVGDAAAGTIGDSAAVDEAQGSRPAAALAAQGGR